MSPAPGPSTRRRIALALAAGVLAAGVIAGLFAAGVIGGGDDNETTDTGQVSVEGSDGQGNGPAGKGGGSEGREGAGSGDSAGGPGSEKRGDADKPDGGSRDQEFHAPEKDKAFFANEAAKSVLTSLGFPRARFAVSGGGEVLTVVVPDDAACAAGPGVAKEIVSRLKEVVLFARKVIVKVESGQTYSAFAASCASQQIPGEGTTLYETSGPGFGNGEQFRVRSKSFTVGYRNTGENLEIYVTKGARVVKPVIKTFRTGVGSETYRGPGKFIVTANGTGRFAVKVTAG